jgi:PAS domain S-box-containing protein
MQLDSGSRQHGSDAHRLELLVDAVTEYAIYTLDQDGFITTWNTGAERIKGYRAAEIIGQHFSRFFAPDDRVNRLPERMMADARAAGRYESEGWRLRKDGSRLWVNSVLHLMRDDHGTPIGFAKITRDMTDRMSANEAVRVQDRRFRLLVDSVMDYAIYMLDPSGLVTNWNRGAERLKGYTADEIIGQHFSRFYTKEERAIGMPARVLDIATREGRCEAEGWRIRKDGSRFWASVVVDAIRNPRGQLEGFAKVTRDITERRAAQDALRESERQFRLLVAGVTDYALYMLDPNGIVVSWNAGAERIKGYKADEIIGQHFSRFYPERDRASGLPARALAIATQDGRFEAEGLRLRRDGALFWANVVIDPIRDEKGDLIGFAKITRDITERRNAQKALQESESQRAHAQKMDALGKLTGGVAHDFNNMLMVVSGYIQTLKKKVADDPKAARAAEAIELAAKRGATLTRQLLTFSRRQTMNPIVVSLGQQVEAVHPILVSALGESIRLISTIGPHVWPVKVDASEFEFALVNLVLNARDATSAGGVISIAAENVVFGPADTKAAIEGEFVALHVSDTGSGIAPDILPNVFDPFFTTKQSDKGSGLGLSQVHGFVHQSGGAITVETELGIGTTFTIYLPRAQERTDGTKVDPALERSVGGRVLLVEDNPGVAEVTVSMLNELGYEVQAVAGPTAALEAIDKQSFDIVISDVVMPEAVNGLDLARILRERKPGVPVLLVTGYSEAAAEAVAEFTVMRKPFDLADLSCLTARMIAESRQPLESNVVHLRASTALTRDGTR